jgi:hypothetical protein
VIGGGLSHIDGIGGRQTSGWRSQGYEPHCAHNLYTLRWGVKTRDPWYQGESTHFNIFQTILLTYAPEHILLAALLHLARKQKFIENEICLLEVEDDVELAYVAVIFVHLLNISMHDFEGNQLVIGGGATGDEEKGGITAVDDLGV